ncbi:hypothetical protein H5181_02415 [Shewanella sp. SG44-2]|jgi:uncharacterized membrane protein YiaA|uniref:hypothetical protein n=1 Tax=Shewanella sp. SG44-2 TaxID=2760962 RepID=UPI001602EF4D|nr:hypothetical protein [Shewanella sp. SG44-2]MBB1382015.1 hypothetical protein [Shewanella sp. SR41-2]MBB1425311.1 hypothetical protein [Shewanella sp. SG44-2]|tara:strand:+ start:864 stop:1124 length:261 start_codon:yes stop_codon:yes gene_type:complete
MFGYIFWSIAALIGAVYAVVFLIKKPSSKFSVISYCIAHAVLLSGACIMALGLFDIALSWAGKFIIVSIIFFHNIFGVWKLNKNEI